MSVTSWSDGVEQGIYAAAKGRIASIFEIDEAAISMADVFGERLLKPRFVSEFKLNELDKVLDDIRDVADKNILKELNSGAVVVGTVEDYCLHMVRCFKANPAEVRHLLKLSI